MPDKPEYEWQDNGDIEIIKKRVCEDRYDEKIDISVPLANIEADGSFKNIEYETDKKDTWHPAKHLEYVLNMQIAYNTPGHIHYHDNEVKEAVISAMRYWADKDFYCEWNGWWNNIGVGLYLPDILLYGVEGLPEETQSKLLEGFKTTLLYNQAVPNNVHSRAVPSIGGNLTDEVISCLKVALIENDGSTIMWLRTLIQNELTPFPAYKWPMNRWDAEGIKEDMSFQQHYQLVYFGGYGDVFMSGMNRLIRYTRDTQFALTKEDLNNYSAFLLDGMQFVTRGNGRDISCSGRGIVRNGGWRGIKGNLTKSINLLLTFDGLEREKDLQRFIDMRTGHNEYGAGGHRYFYESDYNVYNDTKYMATVRHSSHRTRTFEYLNGENPYGYYTGLGATFYYIDGDEYKDIINTYDWNKIPGTTTRQGIIPMLNQDQSYNRCNPNVLVSGVSNGKIGASYTRQVDNTVTSTQAYFMFEDGVVCLGNGINTWMPEEVVTSINQSRLDGNVVLGKNGKRTTLTLGDNMVGKFDYVYHDKMSYITDDVVTVDLEHRAVDYKKTNERASSWLVKADVFSIYKSYGKRPTAEKYAYTVLMDTTPDSTEEYLKNPTLNILCNNTIIQAVYDSKNDVTQAVFHGPSSLKLPDGRRLDISVAGVLIHEKIDGHDVVTISSNSYESLSCAVTVGGQSKIVTIGHKPVRVVL